MAAPISFLNSGLSSPIAGALNQAAGIKAKQPGSIQPQANYIPPSYVAPKSQQTVAPPTPVAPKTQGDPLFNKPGTTTPITGQTPQQIASATNQTPPPPAQPATAAPTPTFPGIMGSLISMGSTPNPVYAANAGALTNLAQQSNQTLEPSFAQPGIGASYNEGIANAQNALSARVSALESAAGVGTAQQTAQQNALGTALTAAQPQVVSPGQAVFNPITGTYSNASSGNTTATTAPSGVDQNAWSQYINDYSTGNFGAIPSSITGNANLYGQLQQAVQSQNPGYNYNAALGSGQATTQNVETQNEAEINALASTYGSNAPQAFALNNSLNNIQSLGSLTLQTAQGGNINPLTIQAGNQTIASLRAQLGSASQAAFDSNMANFQSALTSIYADQSGAIPTQVTQWAQQISSGAMPVQQLQAIYQQAISEGSLRLNNLKSTAGTAYSSLQAAPASGNESMAGSSNSQSAGGYSFQNVNGVWVVNPS